MAARARAQPVAGSGAVRRSDSADSTDAADTEVDPPVYAPGDVIASKYQLSKPLGEGGMGAVWLARNIPLDMDVALKLIRREMASPETEQRLLVEARATAR